ncbi:putative c6 transcription factor [Erysiphe neolycopersici]|uniref:Putative c6 transcription factor n=1 Tax=Erysiphe neolycopersici TaxID=212602 RepID=A0A420I4D0_9PEZI|nr:putative c6 transcription factor [Erysiphe neolycopersici]
MDFESDQGGISNTSTDATTTIGLRTLARNKFPRLYHNKSRTGCQRCRARRVKCSETHPVCTSCNRHGVECLYDRGIGPSHLSIKSSSRSSKKRASNNRLKTEINQAHVLHNECLELPENCSRRLLELRLLHNYIENTCHSLVACNNVSIDRTWQFDVPRMAFKQESLLQGIFSISALQLLRIAPEDRDLRAAQEAYHSAATVAINVDIGCITQENISAIWFAQALFQINLFASLEGRVLEPYTPPLKWLGIIENRRNMVPLPSNLSKLLCTNTVMVVLSNPGLENNDQIYSAFNRQSLIGLLMLDRHEEMWDLEAQHAYERTLSYIGSIRKAILDGENNLVLAGRIVRFPLFAPVKFIRFVEKQHPRALAMLACFFFLASKHTENIWWIGSTPLREFQAIQRILPSEWHPLITP